MDSRRFNYFILIIYIMCVHVYRKTSEAHFIVLYSFDIKIYIFRISILNMTQDISGQIQIKPVVFHIMDNLN